MNALARINHLDLDDTRFSAACAFDGVYAEPPIAGEFRVYDLCQLFPLWIFGGNTGLTSVELRLYCDRTSRVGTPLGGYNGEGER